MIRAPSITTQFRALFRSGDSWFDADRTVESAGKVVSLVDYLDSSHALTQPTSANQPSSPASGGAGWANRLVLTLSSGQWLQSNRTAAQWNYLHSGSGSTVFAVMSATAVNAVRIVMSTRLGGQPGNAMYIINSNQAHWSSSPGPLVAIPSTGPEWYAWTTATAQRTTRNRNTTGTGTGTSSASDAGFSARLFYDGEYFGTGFVWRALYTWQRVLTAGEFAIAAAFARSDVGVRIV